MHHLFDVLVAGCNETEIGLQEPSPSHPLEFLFFQHAQQLGLHLERQCPRFHRGTRFRVFASSNFPGFPSLRAPVKGPFLIAEKLGFEKVLGNGGAVDPDKGVDPAGAGMVDGLGEHLLARARFSCDQDRQVCDCRVQGVLLELLN